MIETESTGLLTLYSDVRAAAVHWLCRTAKHPAQKAEPIQFESKTEKAAYLIKTLLERGDMRSKEVYIRLSDEGIGQRTAEVAKKELGVRCYRKMRQWCWSLTPKAEEKEAK